MGHQEGPLPLALIGTEFDRGGESPQQGKDWLVCYVEKLKNLFALIQHHNPGRGTWIVLSFKLKRYFRAIGTQKTEFDRNRKSCFIGLARRRRANLAHFGGVGRICLIPLSGNQNFRSACLRIPVFETTQVFATAIAKGRQEVFDRCRFPIMAFEIKVHAFAKPFSAKQRMDHPNKLSPFFIDRCCVEVIDLDIGVRAHRMREWAAIFRKLMRPQKPHVGDALHSA